MSDLPVLLVRARERLCGLPLRHVVETLRPLPLEPLQGAPPFVAGVSIIRGQPLPVVDLGGFLGRSEPARSARLVVLRLDERGDRQVALAVEVVLGVRRLDPASLAATPPLLREVGSESLASLTTLDRELLLVLGEMRGLPEGIWDTGRPGEGAAP